MDGNWAVWGSWGLCNTQTGKKERRRECNNPEPINGGATCPESDTEEASCPGNKRLMAHYLMIKLHRFEFF